MKFHQVRSHSVPPACGEQDAKTNHSNLRYKEWGRRKSARAGAQIHPAGVELLFLQLGVIQKRQRSSLLRPMKEVMIAILNFALDTEIPYLVQNKLATNFALKSLFPTLVQERLLVKLFAKQNEAWPWHFSEIQAKWKT